MWLSLNNAFLSIVSKGCKADELLVRSRRKGDIERVFPAYAAKVKRTPGNDYLYRCAIKRADIATVVSEIIMGICYGNFKDSVKDKRLAKAYGAVWGVMSDLQEIPPYARMGIPNNMSLFGGDEDMAPAY